MSTGKRARNRKKEQPHDAVFKIFFGDVVIVRNYLEHYTLPAVHEHIDFSVLRKCDTAFVSGRFGVSFSDVVYETQLLTGAPARILFLFEHKSYQPAQPIYLQLLDYLLQIWEEDVKNKRPLALVIPIVVYHGTNLWEQKSFTDYFGGLPEHWYAFVPDFRYWLTDLSEMSIREIHEKKESERLRNLFLALKLSRTENLVRKNWKKIFNFGGVYEQDDRERILFQTLILYIFNVFDMPQTEIKKLSQELPELENSWIDAIPDILGKKWKKAGLRKGYRKGLKIGQEKGLAKGLEEGLAKGLEEGHEKGREEERKEMVKKVILKFPDWSDVAVAELIEVEETLVRQVRSELTSKSQG